MNEHILVHYMISQVDGGGLKYPKPQYTQFVILLDLALKYLFSIDKLKKFIIKWLYLYLL